MDEEKDYKETEQEEKSTQLRKIEIRSKLRELSNKDSKWTITQEIMQDIVATYTVRDPKNIPKISVLSRNLIEEIETRYSDDPELKALLLESIPADRHVRNWFKKDGWDDAVWSKIKVDGLFTATKRAEVIESLRQRAIEKSDTAAKLYLTMSGDYTEKSEINDKTVDTFREINKILHNKKSEN